MELKKLLIAIFSLLFLLTTVNAVDYYKVYQPSFTNELVEEIYVEGALCANSECSSVTSQSISLLDGDKTYSCLESVSAGGSHEEFQTCLINAELSGNIANLGEQGWIVTKENAPNSFESITYFFPNGDSYVPRVFETTQYPEVCLNEENSYCFDNNIYSLEFSKINEAIAEIGQLNIKNVDNALKPIQVEIPVQIEETVCSAYRFANENYWTPTNIPQGYSNFDATTQIDLLIQDENGNILLNDQVIIPIEAQTCAGLTAFSWTPNASLEDERVTFTVSTEVIDKQVISSLIDYATVTETMYPQNLDGTCWVRAYDFTLANEPTLDLTTSIAQIQEGEFLYAGFSGGAWRDESITPMQFEALFIFDDGNTQTTLSSFQDTSSLETKEYFEDLSSTIAQLQPGNYEVTLVTRPQGVNCVISEDVTQTQQLTILEIPKYSLDVFVTGNESQALEGVSITIELESTRDEFQVTPIYDVNQVTDNLGYSEFTSMIAGTYTYTASKNGYSSITNEIIVGSDTQLYINLPQNNIAPIVDLPEQVSVYFADGLDINLQDYIVDFNDAFSTLDIDVQIVSGQATQKIVNGDVLEVRTSNPNTVEVKVTALDPQGLSSEDTITIEFTNNEKPVISRFEADPTNGQAPFATTFLIQVEDMDVDTLTCTIDFDDGSSETFACSQNDGIIEIDHTFTEIGQYNTLLTLEDGIHSVTLEQKVFVFERTFATPQILTFNFDSSNGVELATNLTFDWTTTHPDNLAMTCTLRVNGVNNAVDCNGDFELNDFATPGVNVFTLIASDGERQDIRRIERTFSFSEDLAPEVSIVADVIEGESPVNVNFNISIQDDNDDVSQLLCVVSFGDGSSIENSCDMLENVSHTYISNTYPISYRALITVTDSVGNEAKAISNLIKVSPKVNVTPIIDLFTVNTIDNSYVIPNTVLINSLVSHPNGLTMVCDLETPFGTQFGIPCNGQITLDHFNISGVSSFTLIATDSEGFVSTQTQIRTFYTQQEAPDLTLEMVGLDIDSVITPGEFNFNIRTINETLAKRQLYIQPTISCGGVTYVYEQGSTFLSTSVLSSQKLGDTYSFPITSDTIDYLGAIPTDTTCLFKVRLVDDYGTDITINKNVMFSYPVKETLKPSIDGYSTDVLDFLDGTIGETFTTGYNKIEFTLVNHESETKEISISLSSAQLGFGYNEEVKLGPNTIKNIDIPLVFTKDQKGTFPVRVAVFDGEQKQVKYSYITIK